MAKVNLITEIPAVSETNLCTRCGKLRIFKKAWVEKVTTGQNVSVLNYSQYVCPDKDCQKLVEKEYAQKQQVAMERQTAQETRDKDRLEARANAAKH